MVTSKRLTRKSGITIPKQVRAESGFVPGMGVDIQTVPEGVLIRKRLPTCQFCGSIEDVIRASGIEMCKACASKLVEEVQQHDL